MVRFGGVGGFFIYPLFKFENAVQLRDFAFRAKLSCQSSINRLFTFTVPNPNDDLFFTVRVLSLFSGAESWRCALRLISGVNARTGAGVGAELEGQASSRAVSVNV